MGCWSFYKGACISRSTGLNLPADTLEGPGQTRGACFKWVSKKGPEGISATHPGPAQGINTALSVSGRAARPHQGNKKGEPSFEEQFT